MKEGLDSLESQRHEQVALMRAKFVSRGQALAALTTLAGPLDAKVTGLLIACDVGPATGIGIGSGEAGRLGGRWARHVVDLEGMTPSEAPGPAEDRFRLPFPDCEFDLLLLVDALEHVPDDRSFVAECHRVLKDSGRLLAVVPYRKGWSLLGPLRRLLGVSGLWQGRARSGYDEPVLFDVLKDGFDVEEATRFSRFFVQCTETFARLGVVLAGVGRDDAAAHAGDAERILMQYRKAARRAAVFYPPARAGALLDRLVPARGYYLAMRARRRTWRPRRTPALKDGRSIAEATINTKIGTASPF